MTELALVEAVALAHAMVDRVASDHDVRVLFIKGPAATAQRLRPARISVDVDVLVDPARRSVLGTALDAWGWVHETPATGATAPSTHSLVLHSTAWSCELELLDRFPGFFGDPQDVFEMLWARHELVDVAARPIPCPDVAAQALVLALNSLRDVYHPVKAAELDFLVARVRETSDRADLDDLARLADALGAADTGAPFLRAVGAPVIGGGTTSSEELRAWHLVTDAQHTGADGNGPSQPPRRRWLPRT